MAKTLTNEQVVGELRKLVKPYIGIMSQAQFSQYCIKIESGSPIKIQTVKDFFAKFGYSGDWNSFKKDVK